MTLVRAGKLMVAVGMVTAWACMVDPKPAINAIVRANTRLREVFIVLAYGFHWL